MEKTLFIKVSNIFRINKTFKCCYFFCLFFVCLFTFSSADVPTYYLDDYCSQTLDMGATGLTSGRLFIRRPGENIRFLKCYMFIKAPSNRRLVFKFHLFDVPSPFGCDNNNLQIMDDVQRQITLTDTLCNNQKVPNKAYITSGEDAAIWLQKNEYLGDQIELVFTVFTYAPCRSDEFECNNAHCISQDLYCNGFDNCGDESDLCLLRRETIIYIVIPVVVVVVIAAILFAVYMYRRQRKIRREKEELEVMNDLASMKMSELHNYSFNADPELDKKSALSDISSIYASHVKRNPSLLNKRDGQMQSLGYYTGPGESTLDRHPMKMYHPGAYESELATKVHYIVHDGNRINPARRMHFKQKHGHSGTGYFHSGPYYGSKDGYASDSHGYHSTDYLYAKPNLKRSKSLSPYLSSLKYPNNEFDASKKKKKNKKKKKKKKDKENGYLNIHESDTSHDVNDKGRTIKPVGYASQEMHEVLFSDKDTLPRETGPAILITNPDGNNTLIHEQAAASGNNLTMSEAADRHASMSSQSTSTMSKVDKNNKSTTNVEINNHPDNKSNNLYQNEYYFNMSRPIYEESSTHFGKHSENQSGIHGNEFRYVDGSPYKTHAVNSKDVEHELMMHPENGPDVTDHVISFRSYPAPVPETDKIVQRTPSRRSDRNSFRSFRE